ncbi:MBL fold metallo-hydrolase [Stygiobacter electus]|uniref:MBL fold metallo-hydrolase n=1 Tax=Stygiobacter electus TaxID=3032292 RepID=A0AAE3P1M8_9BACT|nr:MBL fold metallo-hydrolase [Stygiobacter electus]MDF1612429.1 MBL fold metallo-hydrolase [Stygiobacter electus]
MIKIQRFVFNYFYENTYLVWDDFSKDAIIIDPGMNERNEEVTLNNFVFENSLNLKFLLNTHCHIDHILGNNFIKENYDVEFFAPEEDLFLLKSLEQQASLFNIKFKNSPLPDKYLTEEIELQIGNSKIKFLFTPGHTPGEFCIYLPNEKILFSGDVLFRESIGRTDLWKANHNQLINSIKDKLLKLDDDVIVYPGHDMRTTIGYEKLNNHYLNF